MERAERVTASAPQTQFISLFLFRDCKAPSHAWSETGRAVRWELLIQLTLSSNCGLLELRPGREERKNPKRGQRVQPCVNGSTAKACSPHQDGSWEPPWGLQAEGERHQAHAQRWQLKGTPLAAPSLIHFVYPRADRAQETGHVSFIFSVSFPSALSLLCN